MMTFISQHKPMTSKAVQNTARYVKMAVLAFLNNMIIRKTTAVATNRFCTAKPLI